MMYQEKVIDSLKFRNIMGMFTTGVTVVTVMDDEGPHGMTVNSFTSVSLDPLLTLVCLDKGATTTEILRRTGKFTVNILGEGHREISRRFASQESESRRFEGLRYSISDEGTPILNDVLGYMTCGVTEVVEGGDHLIFIGEVLDLDAVDERGKPLVFYRGNYNSLAE